MQPNLVGHDSRSAFKSVLYVQALQPISSWLDAVPARFGHNVAADNAVLAYIRALDYYFSQRQDYASANAASYHYNISVTLLRDMVHSPNRRLTDHTVVCDY
jgi:hypothetical protein